MKTIQVFVPVLYRHTIEVPDQIAEGTDEDIIAYMTEEGIGWTEGDYIEMQADGVFVYDEEGNLC